MRLLTKSRWKHRENCILSLHTSKLHAQIAYYYTCLQLFLDTIFCHLSLKTIIHYHVNAKSEILTGHMTWEYQNTIKMISYAAWVVTANRFSFFH
jgi:hypothetical protein